MKSLVIIDYGSGNLHSVRQSARRVADEPVSYTHLTLPTTPYV